jgi:hypothetical protein
MPEVSAPALKAEQAVTRRSPTLDQVVADLGVFLVALKHAYGRSTSKISRVDIRRPASHLVQNTIVKGA